MSGATRADTDEWVAAATDLLFGDAMPAVDISVDGVRPALPNVELGPLYAIIFADGTAWPGLDLFEGGAAH